MRVINVTIIAQNTYITRLHYIGIDSTGEQLASLFGIHVHVYMCIEIRIRLKSIFYYIISQ